MAWGLKLLRNLLDLDLVLWYCLQKHVNEMCTLTVTWLTLQGQTVSMLQLFSLLIDNNFTKDMAKKVNWHE